jgi:ABC-type branched-subunit amino acid transport system ATPase component
MIADDAILQGADVDSGYGDASSLHGVSMTVRVGNNVTTLSPNGSGKSTLLKTIVGIVKHTAGRTQFRAGDGQLIDMTNVQRIAWRR